MVAQGGQRVVIRSRSEAAKQQRGRAVVTLKAGNMASPGRRGPKSTVSVLMKDGYGVRRQVAQGKDAFGGYARTVKAPQGAKETSIPVRAGAGARIRGRTTATQPSLLGGPDKELKLYRKAPRAKGRR